MTLKVYHRECLIDLNKYYYLVCGWIVFDCGHTDGQTFLPGLLGHLSGDDQKLKQHSDALYIIRKYEYVQSYQHAKCRPMPLTHPNILFHLIF